MSEKPKDVDRDAALPVTAEVGGEGGSYADAIAQIETKKEPLRKTDLPDRDPSPPGAVAGAVPASPEGPEDGLRGPERGPSKTRA